MIGRCQYCEYFMDRDPDPCECHRHPPVILPGPVSAWPNCEPDDFCGEYAQTANMTERIRGA